MKQFQTIYTDDESFLKWLNELQIYSSSHHLDSNDKIFYICSDTVDIKAVLPAIHALRTVFPNACYAGGCGNGGICNGMLSAEHITVAAVFSERPTTHIEVLQYPISAETQNDSAAALIEGVKSRPWVKAVEMITTIGQADIPKFCEDISELPEEIQLFGGATLARDTHDATSADTYVLSSAGEIRSFNAVFVLWGGEGFHADTRYITGWRGLGLPLEVTEAEGNILKTLDGRPAFEVIQQYLNIPDAADHYFDMAVVFPLCFYTDDGEYLRVSMTHLPDGSLAIASAVKPHSMATFAYGDPAYIMQSIYENAASVRAFSPEMLRMYSCASREYYWGEDVNSETLVFENIASASGAYTGGEFLRSGRSVMLHNVTLVLAAFREGMPAPVSVHPEPAAEKREFSRQILINHCLTTFINAATEQLVEANQKLSKMAVTDGLTDLFNREEIERRIAKSLKSSSFPVLLMADLDDFKMINDTYGHREGDEVLRRVSRLFKEYTIERDIPASIGRWGGEEFMILLEDMETDQAKKLADEILIAFGKLEFPVSGRHTLSFGVTKTRPGDTVDSFCNRVDTGLYQSKSHGKNRTVVI